jgi:3-methyladenine DNA glycosylase/8-oxoguanine DNA glycosylase
VIERRIHITGPFDFRRTLGALGVGEIGGDGSWWWASNTSDGVATVQLTEGDGTVVARAWGAGGDALIDRLPDIVGADDETPLRHACGPALGILMKARGVRLGATGDVHGALVKGVLGQVVTTTEARRSLRALMGAHGGIGPGPIPIRAVPSPEILADLGYEELHRFGIERRRAETLVEVSRRAKRLADVISMPRSEAYARLTSIRGIGAWSAAIVMGTAWGDKDAVPVGDYHLPNSVSWALAGEDRGSDDRMLELLEPYRPERRRVLVAIKQAGIHAPRYGPRSAVRRHL